MRVSDEIILREYYMGHERPSGYTTNAETVHITLIQDHTDVPGLKDGHRLIHFRISDMVSKDQTTVRDEFAMVALGVLAIRSIENAPGGDLWPHDRIAKRAYEIADAMMKERARPREKSQHKHLETDGNGNDLPFQSSNCLDPATCERNQQCMYWGCKRYAPT